MTKVEFTNWLHTELDAVFHGDITPEQVMINAIPMIDLFVSKNCGKPIVSGSFPLSDEQWFNLAKIGSGFVYEDDLGYGRISEGGIFEIIKHYEMLKRQ